MSEPPILYGVSESGTLRTPRKVNVLNSESNRIPEFTSDSSDFFIYAAVSGWWQRAGRRGQIVRTVKLFR